MSRIRRKPQNRAVYRPLVLPTENVLVMEINWPYEIKVEVDPITQSLRLHGVAEKIRAERGQTNVKVSRERRVRNHLVRVADFDTVRDATEFVRSIGIKPEWVADGHRRDHGQALNITELFADPQRIQSIEHSSPQQTFTVTPREQNLSRRQSTASRMIARLSVVRRGSPSGVAADPIMTPDNRQRKFGEGPRTDRRRGAATSGSAPRPR